MNCPLQQLGALAAGDKGNRYDVSWDQADCAWWIVGDERCAVLVAAAHLVGLVAIGDRLLEKMPHEESK